MTICNFSIHSRRCRVSRSRNMSWFICKAAQWPLFSLRLPKTQYSENSGKMWDENNLIKLERQHVSFQNVYKHENGTPKNEGYTNPLEIDFLSKSREAKTAWVMTEGTVGHLSDYRQINNTFLIILIMILICLLDLDLILIFILCLQY